MGSTVGGPGGAISAPHAKVYRLWQRLHKAYVALDGVTWFTWDVVEDRASSRVHLEEVLKGTRLRSQRRRGKLVLGAFAAATLLAVGPFATSFAAATPSISSLDGQASYSASKFAVPVSAGRVVRHTVLGPGKSQDEFSDGSVLATAAMSYVPPAQVKADTVKRLLAGESLSSVVGPKGYVNGNCGQSYVYLTSGNTPSGRGYHYITGFSDTCRSQNAVAVNFQWHVNVRGPGWNKSDYDPGHAIFTYNLQLNNHWATPYSGAYNACVYEPSIAYLSNGGLASSGDPCGGAYIY